MVNLDHLHLDALDRALVELACPDAEKIDLAQLDKGLSGASVWLACWNMPHGMRSAYHVLKIGNSKKIEREIGAIDRIVSAIDPAAGHMRAYSSPTVADRMILRQQFLGDSASGPLDLRARLRTCSPEDARKMVARLYHERMKPWHVHLDHSGRNPHQEARLGEALDWWTSRLDIPAHMSEIGIGGLTDSLAATTKCTPDEITRFVGEVAGNRETILVAPVHGDLHAQNILFSAGGEINLIDFGWTDYKWKAIDFLMLECSLKFLCCPSDARLEDLLELERQLEAPSGRPVSLTSIADRMHGNQLEVIGAAIDQIRTEALHFTAVADFEQYRRGLILLTAALASCPGLNRIFLFHSLGYHIQRSKAVA